MYFVVLDTGAYMCIDLIMFVCNFTHTFVQAHFCSVRAENHSYWIDGISLAHFASGHT